MRRTTLVLSGLIAIGWTASLGSTSGCGGSSGSHFGSSGGGSSGTFVGGSGGNLVGGNDGGNTGGGTPNAQCPAGATCNVTCSSGGTTSISGKVYDPAMKDGLYNVAVYVPGGPIQPLPKGVLTGTDACSCSALFKSGAVVSTVTGVDGSFKLSNVPVGAQIPLVLQIGKWRRVVSVNTTMCADAPQPDKSLSLPATVTNANDNIPDIAVSTGNADTLECLMYRIGLPASEYTAGAGGAGHVHVFSGGTSGRGQGQGGGNVGKAEKVPMQGAPASNESLWSSQAQLMPFDIVLLSCEGGETYNANPPALEAYLNAGGRAFGSHFHYAWFAGPLSSSPPATYAAPADWGNSLATWQAGGGTSNGTSDGVIVQTLNGSTASFPKGVAFFQWLGLNNALGVNGAPPQELPIVQPRFNAVVGPANTPSQPWINNDDPNMPNTMYFSFDTPVNAGPNVCGRAVFSDLHVAGGSNDDTSQPPPADCETADLSPQEKALEFMLFDLSACVIPDTQAPSTNVPIQ